MKRILIFLPITIVPFFSAEAANSEADEVYYNFFGDYIFTEHSDEREISHWSDLFASSHEPLNESVLAEESEVLPSEYSDSNTHTIIALENQNNHNAAEVEQSSTTSFSAPDSRNDNNYNHHLAAKNKAYFLDY